MWRRKWSMTYDNSRTKNEFGQTVAERNSAFRKIEGRNSINFCNISMTVSPVFIDAWCCLSLMRQYFHSQFLYLFEFSFQDAPILGPLDILTNHVGSMGRRRWRQRSKQFWRGSIWVGSSVVVKLKNFSEVVNSAATRVNLEGVKVRL